MGITAPIFAQQNATVTPAQQKWRPTDGLYAAPDLEFKSSRHDGDLNVEIAENNISGYEWGWAISKLTDTAPGAIRLEMTCSNYNLAGNLNLSKDSKFNETMALKKVDDISILIRKSLNEIGMVRRVLSGIGTAFIQRKYCKRKARRRAKS